MPKIADVGNPQARSRTAPHYIKGLSEIAKTTVPEIGGPSIYDLSQRNLDVLFSPISSPELCRLFELAAISHHPESSPPFDCNCRPTRSSISSGSSIGGVPGSHWTTAGCALAADT